MYGIAHTPVSVRLLQYLHELDPYSLSRPDASRAAPLFFQLRPSSIFPCLTHNAQADFPVVQLSIDETQPPSFHYDIGQRLAPLREEGVLILGSGNVVHNLHAYAWGRHAPEPYDWAISFETRVRELLLAGDYKPLVNYEHQLGTEADLAVPTPDHFLPLLYVAGTRISSEPLTFPVEGVDGGSVSMLAVRVG
jgi:4,5-DOPA dioxygenase extradiol